MNFFQFLWLYSPICFFPLEILLDQISCLLDLSAISVNFSLKFCIFVYLFYNHRMDFTLSFSFFLFFLPHQAACRILVPWLEIEPGPLQWKCRILIIGLQRSFQIFLYPLTFLLLLSFLNLAILCGSHKNSFKFSGCSFFIATSSCFYGWITL